MRTKKGLSQLKLQLNRKGLFANEYNHDLNVVMLTCDTQASLLCTYYPCKVIHLPAHT